MWQILVGQVDLCLKLLSLLLGGRLGQLGPQLEDSVVGLLLQLETLLVPFGLLAAHTDRRGLGSVLLALNRELPLHLRLVLLGCGEALGALDSRGVVKRRLRQGLAVLVERDFALAPSEVELLLLLGQGAHSLAGRVVLGQQAGGCIVSLTHADILAAGLRRALLRLTLLDVGDLLLDVLACDRELGLLLGCESARLHGGLSSLVEFHQLLLELLGLRLRGGERRVDRIDAFLSGRLDRVVRCLLQVLRAVGGDLRLKVSGALI